MVIKSSQRGGGRQAVNHFLNAYDNEVVDVAEVRGAVARDPHGAVMEWAAQARGTRCKKYLFTMSVNPDPRQGALTRAQYFEFFGRVEDRLGLKGQPRIVIFHRKNEREHAHVTWSRINGIEGRAVHLPHDRLKMRTAVREFARDHGLTLPEDKRKTQKDRFNEKAQNLAERQQQERTGLTPEEIRKRIGAAWEESQSAEAFIKQLDAHGFYLARGDKRVYVVVDMFGEVHSLSRQLPGVKMKQIKERLADIDLDRLRSVDEAQDHARERRNEWIEEQQEKKLEAQRREQVEQRRAELEGIQKERRERFDADLHATEGRHDRERKALTLMQAAESSEILAARAKKEPRGIRLFLARITGVRFLTEMRQRRQDSERVATQTIQIGALARRHQAEQQEIARRQRDLAALDTRERQSFETALRREENQRLAARQRDAVQKNIVKETQTPPTVQADFRRAAVKPESEQQRGGGPTPQREKRDIRPDFARVAQPEKTGQAGGSGGPRVSSGQIAAKFNEAAHEREDEIDHSSSERSPLQQAFDDVSGPDREAPPEPGDKDPEISNSLASAFNRHAEQPEQQPEHDHSDPAPDKPDRGGPGGWER